MSSDNSELLALVKDTAEATREAVTAVQATSLSVSELRGEVHVLNTTVAGMSKDVDTLNKLIRGDGDTSKSLLSRVQLLEIEEVQRKKSEATRDKHDLFATRARWKLAIMSISAVSGLVTTIIQLLFSPHVT